MSFSREAPSPRYRRLVDEYREMHEHGERWLGVPAQNTFDGRSLLPQAHHIRRLIRATGATSLLDYGSGKGQQYELARFVAKDDGKEYPGVKAYWGIEEVRCYDPGYAPFSALPTGVFDGVISTDVLEHCPEEDIAWILGELFSFARKFVFANVACFPARKHLPSGINAHCTVKPAEWWYEQIGRAAGARPDVRLEFRLGYIVQGKLIEGVISA